MRGEARRGHFEIKNKLGLHARAAMQLVRLASQFESEITVGRGEQVVSGKSILGLMTLAAGQGTVIEVAARGPDAEEALRAIGELIERRFDEEE